MREIKLKDGSTLIIKEGNRSHAKEMMKYIDAISTESDFLTFGQGEFNITLEEEEKFIESVSKKDNAIFIVAEIEGKIVGNLSFSGGGRPRIAHTGEMGVSVLKDYWGQGIGTELIKYLIHWSKESNIIKKINLRVRTDNVSGIGLYKKLGFVEEGSIKRDFFTDGKFYDSLCMGLLID
ncbi:GNAT family N-acetyltransferase [Anaeromicrobium sediminis]|uniref:GNAT family N-acetyltransferase n=1 Tax=Anaeromicrobium sediminis TaxID=1478221 RepID=A0A267MLG1_9FIRM|nr:GNAT family protein [Anaeromicrobium sediminis]PAB60267.1 GNAT family N-acetyltransferase [Anaeromicrobium sediminis]